MDSIKEINLVLDAAFDLWQASLPREEADCDDFAAAYTRCAEEIGELAGVEVTVRLAAYDDGPGAGVEDFGLWQAVHDCLVRDEEAGKWDWSADLAKEKARSLRRRLEKAAGVEREPCSE